MLFPCCFKSSQQLCEAGIPPHSALRHPEKRYKPLKDMGLIHREEFEPLTTKCLTQSHCPTGTLILKIGCFELAFGMWAPQNVGSLVPVIHIWNDRPFTFGMTGTKHCGCPCPPPFATKKLVWESKMEQRMRPWHRPPCLKLSPHRTAIEDSPACPDIPVASKEMNVLYF